MAHKCIVRNTAYRKGELNLRERHNERKNESYGNGDIDKERSELNVHFKKCEGTYEQAFNKLLTDGTISTRGLGENPKIVDEFVFDVNTSYFEENGGYEYAKEFFAEAYQLAVKEAGGEEFILSAVMHANELNKAVSEQLGKDVYHYHLHVAYVPVVDKEIKWSKRCKDESLVGITKEVIKQVSHSKKWTRDKQYDEKGEVIRNDKGKAILINSYSLLQDRYFEHMKQAGFKDFERGSRGSTAKHLTDLEYKIAKDKERLDGLTEELGEKSERVEKLNNTIQTNEKTLGLMKEKFKVAKVMGVTFNDIESMASKNIKGKFELAPNDWRELVNLAKKGVLSDSKLNELMVQVKSIKNDSAIYKRRLDTLLEETKAYNQAKKLNPKKLEKLLDDVIAEGKPKLEQTEVTKTKNRGHELE